MASVSRILARNWLPRPSPFDAPMAYRISAAGDDGNFVDVAVEPEIAVHYDQVFHPNSFVFRRLFDKPTTTRTLSIELLDRSPGTWWSIHELALWAK